MLKLMDGFVTPEEAALARSIPSRFQRVVGVETESDHARVYRLTNDRPPFEEHTDYCCREGGRWFNRH
jgi:hypothetical protein